jgi:hypothetical protein
MIAHDPEKWEPVFGEDHAPAKTAGRAGKGWQVLKRASHCDMGSITLIDFQLMQRKMLTRLDIRDAALN